MGRRFVARNDVLDLGISARRSRTRPNGEARVIRQASRLRWREALRPRRNQPAAATTAIRGRLTGHQQVTSSECLPWQTFQQITWRARGSMSQRGASRYPETRPFSPVHALQTQDDRATRVPLSLKRWNVHRARCSARRGRRFPGAIALCARTQSTRMSTER
jgi:hypothetical protein